MEKVIASTTQKDKSQNKTLESQETIDAQPVTPLVNIVARTLYTGVRASFVCLVIFISATLASESVDANTDAQAYTGSISLGYAHDSDGTNDWFLDLDASIASGLRFLFSAGLTRINNSDSENESYNYLFGVLGDPEALINLGLEYEHIKELDIYTIDTVRLTLGFNMDKWSFDFVPQHRNFISDIGNLIPVQINLPNATSRITGIGGEFAYYGFQYWLLSLGYTKYYFDNDDLLEKVLNRLNNLDNEIAQNQRRLFTSSLEDNRWTVSADYVLDWGGVGLEWNRSAAIKPPEYANVYTFSLTADLTETVTAELELGALTVSYDESILSFGILSFGYFW